MVPSARIAYIVAKNKARKHERRARLIEMLGGKCVRCGVTKRLEFDHVDPKTKQFVVCSDLSRPWDELVEEALRCQLLCRPCHKEKGCRLPRSWDHSEGFSATSMGPPGCQ